FDRVDQLLLCSPAVGDVLRRAEESEILPSGTMFRAQLDMNPAGIAIRSYPAALDPPRRSRRDRVLPRIQKCNNVVRVNEGAGFLGRQRRFLWDASQLEHLRRPGGVLSRLVRVPMADLAATLGFQVLAVGLFGEYTLLFYRLFSKGQFLLGLFETTKLRCKALEQNGKADYQADGRQH